MRYTKLASVALALAVASSCVSSRDFHLTDSRTVRSQGPYRETPEAYEVRRPDGSKSKLAKRHVVEIEEKGEGIAWPDYWTKRHGVVRNVATFPFEVVATPFVLIGKIGTALF